MNHVKILSIDKKSRDTLRDKHATSTRQARDTRNNKGALDPFHTDAYPPQTLTLRRHQRR